jgi:peptide/nickel transport system substrate-binding protein
MNRKRTLQKVLGTAVLAGVMVFAAACGSNNNAAETPANNNNAANNQPAATVAPAPGSTEVGNRDGVFIYGGQGWDGRFISIMSTNLYDGFVNSLVFQGLLTNDPAGNPIPLIATHWEVNEDYTTYTFFMDPRATFTNGNPVTAWDVEFTYRTLAHPDYDGPRRSAVTDFLGFEDFVEGRTQDFPGVRVIDAHTVEFNVVVASPQHIWDFSWGILCREHYAFNTWDDFIALMGDPMGSGQFVFEEHVFQQWIEFSRNDNYWDPDVSINLAGIVMRDVPTASIIPATITGEIHHGQIIASLDFLEELRNGHGVSEILYTANSLRHLTFNTNTPQLSDHRVRQALVYAFDTETYILADAGDLALRAVATNPFSRTSWANPGNEGLNLYEFNMARANELMDEAGWIMNPATGIREKDGEIMRLTWLIYHEAAWPGIITGMATHTWGELGVELDIQMMDFAVVSAMTTQRPPEEREFHLYQMGWSMGIDPDLSGGLWDMRQFREGGFNGNGWQHDRFQELIVLGAQTMAIEDRIPIYHEIAELHNYYLPIWVIDNGMNLHSRSDEIHNFELGVFTNWVQAIIQQGTWVE